LADQQIKIAEKSQQRLTFSSPWWRNSCRRLSFGLCSAPEIFQMVATDFLGDIEGVEVFMDDILIFTKSYLKAAHETLTKIVMERQKTAGF
jgi:hypothetical protein